MKTFVKQIPIEITAAILAICASSTVLGATLGFSTVMEKYTRRNMPAAAAPSPVSPGATEALAGQGRHLYLQNCAHCHAADASGDDGPDLRVERKDDEHITHIIMNGIQGEMPKFGSKLKDADVQALLAFIHSIKKK